MPRKRSDITDGKYADEADRDVGPGHNQPGNPHRDAFVRVTEEMAAWLGENPVIQSQEQATECARLVKIVKDAGKAAEAERTELVAPHSHQVTTINGLYAAPRLEAKSVIDSGNDRMTAFARAEEAKRAAEAARLKAEAEAAAQAVRDAEAKEREIAENAAAGEIGGDVLSATREADAAFGTYQETSRLAKVAEKDSRLRVNTGGARAASMRNVEVLKLTSMREVWGALDEQRRADVTEAFLKAARAHRKATGSLPPGVAVETDRRFV